MAERAPSRRWTEPELEQVLLLYFQLPFGKLDARTPEVKDLALLLDRTANSVAMKLNNMASLDPEITGSGRKGLPGASALDRSVYQRFTGDWERAVPAAEQALVQLASRAGPSESQRLTTQRLGQDFFRRAVLANFDERCCITGIAEPALLVASHIRPWAVDTENRHNPANGLALSATFDRAFDRGLLSVDAEWRLLVSRRLTHHADPVTSAYFRPVVGQPLRMPSRQLPDRDLLAWHRSHCFQP
jgi:putative restriction endonuclease